MFLFVSVYPEKSVYRLKQERMLHAQIVLKNHSLFTHLGASGGVMVSKLD